MFHPTPGPTDEDIAQVATSVWRRVTRKLAEDQPTAGHDDFVEAAPLLAAISEAAVGASATGPRWRNVTGRKSTLRLDFSPVRTGRD